VLEATRSKKKRSAAQLFDNFSDVQFDSTLLALRILVEVRGVNAHGWQNFFSLSHCFAQHSHLITIECTPYDKLSSAKLHAERSRIHQCAARVVVENNHG